MEIEISPRLQKQLAETKRKHPRLYSKIRKQLHLFVQQPNHPSLRLHKLIDRSRDTWSISIDKSIRMLFYYRVDGDQRRAFFTDLGTHDELYRR